MPQLLDHWYPCTLLQCVCRISWCALCTSSNEHSAIILESLALLHKRMNIFGVSLREVEGGGGGWGSMYRSE